MVPMSIVIGTASIICVLIWFQFYNIISYTLNLVPCGWWESQRCRWNDICKDELKIYVYDMPASLNYQIAAEHPYCEEEPFGTEIFIHQAILNSPYHTKDPNEAHLFYVPVYAACLVYRNFKLFAEYRALVKKSLDYVRGSFPYFDRSNGRDHVWAFVHDFGSCLSWHDTAFNGIYYKQLRNSIFISHLGDLNIDCFATHKDIVIPPMTSDESIYQHGGGGAGSSAARTTFVYFRGTVHWTHGHDIPELGISKGKDATYSNGVRDTIVSLYGNDTLFSLNEGSSESYVHEVQRSVFCLCPRGFATWSRRLFDSIMLGCIPVIIADGIELPFEHILDYSKFTLKVLERDIRELKEILVSVSAETIASKQRELRRVWKMFSYQRPTENGDAFDAILQQLTIKARPRTAAAYAEWHDLARDTQLV